MNSVVGEILPHSFLEIKMKLRSVKDQVWSQVRDQVRDQVRNQVWYQVRNQANET